MPDMPTIGVDDIHVSDVKAGSVGATLTVTWADGQQSPHWLTLTHPDTPAGAICTAEGLGLMTIEAVDIVHRHVEACRDELAALGQPVDGKGLFDLVRDAAVWRLTRPRIVAADG